MLSARYAPRPTYATPEKVFCLVESVKSYYSLTVTSMVEVDL